MRTWSTRTFGCAECKIAVIPNFVNLQEYHPVDPQQHDGLAPAGHKLITHVSNFREVKRVKMRSVSGHP